MNKNLKLADAAYPALYLWAYDEKTIRGHQLAEGTSEVMCQRIDKILEGLHQEPKAARLLAVMALACDFKTKPKSMSDREFVRLKIEARFDYAREQLPKRNP